MKKGLTYGLMIVIVLILGCGIFTVGKRLMGSSTDKKTGDSKVEQNTLEEVEETTTEEEADNSVPMTSLTVTAPKGFMRVGDTMQLEIKTEPADATNTKLKWTCSEKDFVSVDKDGVLTPAKEAEKSTVTVTAEATDGSGLTQSFDLRIYPEIDPSKPMVAITLDDGPNPSTTNAMLDAFEENYALATFFCLGPKAEAYPEVVKREYDLGMEVGTHSYQHETPLTNLTGSALDDAIGKGAKAIEKATGAKPNLLRPPFGNYNKEVLSVAKNYGLSCMYWSLDTEDWKTKNPDATYKMVMQAVDGDVVLLHDIHEYNVKAVQNFVPDLIAEGFQLVTVPELYKYRGESLDPGTVHFRTDPTTEGSGETTAAESTDGASSEASTQAQ
ncbi:MAG: polysaccharide deacetylase family protein [Eubacteriales bacterium]|nr:polysaccharide deacetylase family protein [Eubacteriales bacterium]